MSAWKQIVFALVVVAVACVAWVRFFPGSGELLSRWGVEWVAEAIGAPQEIAARPDGGSGHGGSGGGGPVSGVVTEAVSVATINDNLSAIGTGRANSSVTVTPYSSGRITEILVASGDRIASGEVLVRLDSDAEEIVVDRARIAVDDAQARLDRINALRTTNTATAVQVTDAEVALGNAKLALRDAELALERRSIVAPIAGIVGILPVEIGGRVTSDTAIVTIDDRSSIIVDFWVPERYASAVEVGMPLTAFPIGRPSDEFDGSVSAVDNRLDAATRTLLVRARIENSRDTLRAGMSFKVSMRFPGDTYPAVSPLAIQWGTDGSFVWSVVDGRAQRTMVRIVQRNTESVLVEAPIAPGDLVVTEGVHAVREGVEILIAEGANGRRAEASPSGS
ncbi:MAG: efflux RND transporter periplasmic adaptor subunit [Rhizobiaceae bacterium]